MIQPLKWTKPYPGTVRAYSPDGVYFIHRYKAVPAAPGQEHRPAFWDLTFYDESKPEGERVSTVEWNAPDSRWKHTLEHAKASCQRHANTRLAQRLTAPLLGKRVVVLDPYTLEATVTATVIDWFEDGRVQIEFEADPTVTQSLSLHEVRLAEVKP